MILFWFKTSIAASSMRVQCKSPNTLLGVIPLGSSTQTIPLRNIASVDTNIFLIAGLACMKDSALVGILFLVLAAANLANTMNAQLDFVNQAGGRNTVKVSILKKAKLMQLAQAIQQLVFADVEGQRHQESMDMLKAHAAELRAWASDAGVRLPSAESAGELREQVRDLPQEPQIQEQPGYGYQPGFQQPQQWQQQPWN